MHGITEKKGIHDRELGEQHDTGWDVSCSFCLIYHFHFLFTFANDVCCLSERLVGMTDIVDELWDFYQFQFLIKNNLWILCVIFVFITFLEFYVDSRRKLSSRSFSKTTIKWIWFDYGLTRFLNPQAYNNLVPFNTRFRI